MLSIRGMALLAAALGTAASTAAQSMQRLPNAEIAIDYSYMRANAAPGQCGCFSLNGGSVEAAVHAYRDFSLVAGIAGEHAGATSVPGQSLSLIFFTGGPRFSYPLHYSPRTTILPFVQGLVGAAHGFDAPFPNSSGGLSTSATGLAVFAGGGVDLAFGHRIAIRAVQIDYGLNHLPNNATNRENLLRVSAGVVFRIR